MTLEYDKIKSIRSGEKIDMETPLFLAADAYFNFSDFIEKEKIFLKISSWFSNTPLLSENDYEHILNLAITLFLSGNYKKGEEFLEKLENIESNEPNIPKELIQTLILANNQNYDEAFTKLNEILPFSIDEKEFNLIMGILDLLRGALSSGLSYGNRILKNYKNDGEALLLNSILYFKDGKFAESLKLIKKLNDNSPSSEQLNFQAFLYFKLNEIDKAINSLDLIEEKNEIIYSNLAWLNLIRGKVGEARKILIENCSQNRGNSLKILGDIYVIEEEYGNAILNYSEYLKKNINDKTTIINLTQCYLLEGEVEEAYNTLIPLFKNDNNVEKRAHELRFKIELMRKLAGENI